MADLRIVDAPVLLQESITDDVKMPTGGLGNYAIRLGDLVWYVVAREQLANKNYVDLSSKGVKDSLDVHITDKANPHNVTKAQVGLGNVDNTADIDKPVSNAVNSAIITATTDMATKAYVNSRDKATTLVGYGISDAYTKSEIDTNYGGVKTLYDKNVEAGAGVNGWIDDLIAVKNGNWAGAIERTQHDKNAEIMSVKDFGAKGDGVTDDTLALMHACANFNSGILVIPPGKYVINYNTTNPYFKDKVGSMVGANICRSPMFFGLKNATVYGYGAEIFVKNNAKTALDYDATFGVFMNVGGCENFTMLGLTINGNAFNQPCPGTTWNSLYIPRNHGFTFFNKADSVYKDIHFYDCTFKELGWHDTRNLESGDNAGDGILFFGIKNLTDVYIERNKFIDIGRWACAVDILTDHTGMYRNININKNTKISVKNLTLGYANKTRELGFYDHEVACGFDVLNVCDNILIDGRPAIRIGGSERQNSTSPNTRCTIARNIVRVDHEHVWYMFGFSDQRDYQNMQIVDNIITISSQHMPLWTCSQTTFTDSKFDRNNIRLATPANDIGGAFPILMNGGGFRDNTSCRDNIFDGIGISFQDDPTVISALTIRISDNTFYNCRPIQGGLSNINIAFYAINNTFGQTASRSSVDVITNANNQAPTFIMDNIDYRVNVGAESERLQGKVIVKNSVKFVPTYMQPVSSSYMGYYLAGSPLLVYPTPQNRYRELVCVSEGFCINAIRGDKEWTTAENIDSIYKYYGPTYRYNGTKLYQAITTGTTGSVAPTHTVGDVSDGGVTWRYIGVVATFAPSNPISLLTTTAYDPPSLVTNTQQSTTVTLTGAKLGDNVSVSFDKPLQGTRIWAEVTAENTVTVYYRNDTGVTVDLPSGTLTVKVV